MPGAQYAPLTIMSAAAGTARSCTVLAGTMTVIPS